MRGQTNERPLSPEAPVEIVVNGRLVATLMCSPFDLDELALGHVFSRGLVAGRDDVLSLNVCPDRTGVRLESSRPIEEGTPGLGATIPSACGSGASDRRGPPRVVFTEATFPIETLRAWFALMFERVELYHSVGGVHCAAIATLPAGCGDEAIVVREDVGRHNAVDKVVGRALLDGRDRSRSCILSSGRISVDFIQKAAAAGVPVVASRSVPTSAAYDLALGARIAMIGRIGSASPIVYTCPERISD